MSIAHWGNADISDKAHHWLLRLGARMGAISSRSPWWSFIFDKPRLMTAWLQNFVEGKHRFLPLREYHFKGESITVWGYLDRMFLHLLLQMIRPTFKYVIPENCFHLAGPSVIKKITKRIKAALETGDYHYVIRLDIRSFYASINHEILIHQLTQHYQDEILLKYFRDIITIPIDKNALLFLPQKGIPLRSSLSPFFGAIYLSPLDLAFEGCKNVSYFRFMDDLLILLKTKRQLTRARKKIFTILRQLKKVSREINR